MITIDRTDRFPSAPGVYMMRGADGTVLYVGKARDLRKRVRSYFSASSDSRLQIRFLMERVTDIDTIVTDTEKEALILENTLIKRHHPRYNFNLRDDKTYFSLRLDPRSEFPRLTVIRKVPRDGALYFGPYSSAAAARRVLKELHKLFPLRHYPLQTCRRRNRPCLFYQLKQCSAPCHGAISAADYALLVEGAILFLGGKSKELIRLCRKRMNDAATAEDFESAARYRDLIHSIEQTVERQKVVTQGGDADIVGYYRQGKDLEIALLFMRGGMITGNRNYSLTWELDDAEGIASFLHEYYSQEVSLPDEVIVPLPLVEAESFAELLSEQRTSRVTIFHPQRGIKKELVELAIKNASMSAHEKRSASTGKTAALAELKERLHLRGLPRTIECYDISNLQGDLAVGSRVVFREGSPDKEQYRRYRITSVDQADDFAMMYEVLRRRFRRDDGEPDHPDLIIVDGGIGQLNVLTRVVKELGLEGVDMIALAKSRVRKGMSEALIRRSDERVFLPGRKNPVVLRADSAPLLLLAQIRDEAHRFAISYHKKLRGKAALASPLDEIDGVGSKRKQALLKAFGSLKKIREASAEELCKVKGMNRVAAEALLNQLRER